MGEGSVGQEGGRAGQQVGALLAAYTDCASYPITSAQDDKKKGSGFLMVLHGISLTRSTRLANSSASPSGPRSACNRDLDAWQAMLPAGRVVQDFRCGAVLLANDLTGLQCLYMSFQLRGLQVMHSR